MAYSLDCHLRPAAAEDAEAIAELHAESWRRHYRGTYSDSFLDGDVLTDRLTVWRQRLHRADDLRLTVVAEVGGRVVAFAHIALDEDPTWGALLDNLHVDLHHQRDKVGSRLLASIAPTVAARRTGLYLWVQEQNVNAQAFYRALGANRVERAAIQPPGGVASRLTGSPMKLRYAWAEPQLETITRLSASDRRPLSAG